jgi:hypothetical protein
MLEKDEFCGGHSLQSQTQESEAGGSLEPKRSRLPEQQPRLHIKKKKR